jgi:hypothetical protein
MTAVSDRVSYEEAAFAKLALANVAFDVEDVAETTSTLVAVPSGLSSRGTGVLGRPEYGTLIVGKAVDLGHGTTRNVAVRSPDIRFGQGIVTSDVQVSDSNESPRWKHSAAKSGTSTISNVLVYNKARIKSFEVLPPSLRNNWQGLATSGISEAQYARIKKLAHLPDGWRGENSRPLSSKSLHNFLEFWRSVRSDSREPFLTLTPNGHLYAEWHASWKRHLDAEFSDMKGVYFGLFQGSNVLDGRDNAIDLATMLLARRVNPLKWGTGLG